MSGHLFLPINPINSAHSCQAPTECRDGGLCVMGRGLQRNRVRRRMAAKPVDTHKERKGRRLAVLGPVVPSRELLGNRGAEPHNSHFGAKGIPCGYPPPPRSLSPLRAGDTRPRHKAPPPRLVAKRRRGRERRRRESRAGEGGACARASGRRPSRAALPPGARPSSLSPSLLLLGSVAPAARGALAHLHLLRRRPSPAQPPPPPPPSSPSPPPPPRDPRAPRSPPPSGPARPSAPAAPEENERASERGAPGPARPPPLTIAGPLPPSSASTSSPPPAKLRPPPGGGGPGPGANSPNSLSPSPHLARV